MKYIPEVIALISVKPKSLKTKQKLKNKQKNPIKKIKLPSTVTG